MKYQVKLHSKSDMDHGLIREIEVTTASVHNSQVDLSKDGEVIYSYKGYSGTTPKGYNATMKQSVREHSIKIKDVLRNSFY